MNKANIVVTDGYPLNPGDNPWDVVVTVGNLTIVPVYGTLHAPLTADNHRFVNRSLLERMKKSAILINASRGALIEENGLAEALKSGRLAGAVVDVVSTEPIAPDNPLLSARNIAITPHLAWATREARRRLMASTAENIRAFLDDAPQNLVNAIHLAPA